MPDNPTGDVPWREGERYDETMGGEHFFLEVLDPEEAQQRITQFTTGAEELPGPHVAELAEQVGALMRASSRECEAIMDGKPHHKVLATLLSVGQRARAKQPEDPQRWQRGEYATERDRYLRRQELKKVQARASLSNATTFRLELPDGLRADGLLSRHSTRRSWSLFRAD